MENMEIADLKERFPLYIRAGFFLAVLFFIVVFFLVPHYSLHPYVPRVDRATQVEVEPEEIEAIEETDESAEDVDITETGDEESVEEEPSS